MSPVDRAGSVTGMNCLGFVLGLSSYLTKEPTSFPTFQVKARLYVTFIAVRKHNFLDSFLVLFCFVLFCVQKMFAVTIQNIIP